MAGLDLVIRGGQVVQAGTLMQADIGISGGRIAQIGGEMGAAQEIDAAGKLVLPGGVDAHVHLTVPPDETGEPHWVDDFTSGSAGALAGGITTLGNMSFLAPGELPLDGLEREANIAWAQAIADYFLHPVLGEPTPRVLDQIPALRAAGCNSIKIFLSFPGFDAQVRAYV